MPIDELEHYLTAHYEQSASMELAYRALHPINKKRLREVAKDTRYEQLQERIRAIHSMSYERITDTETTLVHILRTEPEANFEQWHAAIIALQQICSEAGRAALLEILDAPPEADWRRELFALQTLAHCGTLEDVPVVERCVSHPNAEIVRKAQRVLALLQQKFTPPPDAPQP